MTRHILAILLLFGCVLDGCAYTYPKYNDVIARHVPAAIRNAKRAVIIVVDFRIPSSRNRMFVMGEGVGHKVYSGICAHGEGGGVLNSAHASATCLAANARVWGFFASQSSIK